MPDREFQILRRLAPETPVDRAGNTGHYGLADVAAALVFFCPDVLLGTVGHQGYWVTPRLRYYKVFERLAGTKSEAVETP